MGLEKRLPSSLPPPFRGGLDAVSLEDVADRLIGDLVAEIGQGTLDAVVSPVRILLGHTKNKLFDFIRDSRSSWFLFAPIGVVPFLRHQLTMPTENRVRSDNRGQLRQNLSPQGLPLTANIRR